METEQFVQNRKNGVAKQNFKIANETSAKVQNQTPKKNLWVITELYYPEETSTGYYLTKIAEGLADTFQVKALCGQPNYSGRGTRAPKKEFHRGVEIYRAPGTTFDKNVIVFRLINMLTLSFSIFLKAILNFKKNDRILVVTTPPSLPFIAAFAARIRGGSYDLLIHDNYPEILIAVGKTRENSLLVKTINFFNRRLFKYANQIIVVGRDMNKLVAIKMAGLRVPITYIPNWAESDQLKPEPRHENTLLEELALKDKFVFLYAGNMGYPNDLESIVWCAEKLNSDPNFHFIFLGSGVKRKWLEIQKDEKKLGNITVLSPRPRSEQNTFLNACDVAIVSLISKMRGVSMPSRTYNILAVGKPILALAEKNSEIARVIEEDLVGWVVPPNEPERLLQMIIKIFNEMTIIGPLGMNARKSALEKYSLELAISRYKNALD